MSYTTLIRHTRVYQEAQEEGVANVVIRQLKKRFGQEVSHIDARTNREFTLSYSLKFN